MADKAEIWQCPQCGASLNIAELGFYAQVVCPSCEHSEYVHTMLANFRIEGVVGVGGMSVVLRARDLVLNRCVAIKVLNDTYRNQPDRISRFENECAMMAKVRHDNVVSVFSAGRARKQFYIAMELVDGRDLETTVNKEGVLPPLKAIEYTIQIVKGLEAAHKAGLLHRDMKPGNVIITPEGQAKVLDFGLALGKQDEDTEEIIWATPYYVPPETLERKEEDCRTDIYALGMTLRYLLTGNEQFKEAASSVSDLLQSKFKLPPMASIMPDADDSLCDLVDHMTAYEPSRRPANYRDLLAELQAVKAALESSQLELQPESRRRARTRLMATVGATSALGVGAAVAAAMLAAPEPEGAYVSSGEGVYSWYELDACKLAEQELEKADFNAALGRFKQLSEDASCEPLMAAWATLNASFLAMYLQDEPLSDQLYKRFLEFVRISCGRTLDDKVPGTHKDCLKGVELLKKESAHQAELLLRMLQFVELAENQNPEIKVTPGSVNGLVEALYYIRLGKEKYKNMAMYEGASAFAIAARAIEATPGAYAQLREPMRNLTEKWQPATGVIHLQLAKAAMDKHDIATARRELQTALANVSGKNAQSEEIKVLLEVCEVAEHVFNMIRRKAANQYAPGDNPEKVRGAVFELKQNRLHDEVFALCFLLKGNYEAAFSNDPYRSDADSNEPFAVMMRDWKKRLGR